MAIKRFEDVTQKALEVFLGGLEEPTMGYRALFPEEFTSNLSWESLEASGNMTVAADVVAHNASVKLKARPDAALATGRIPKIGLLNTVGEKELHDLYALTMSPRNLEDQIFNIIFGDVARAYYGVHARLEMLAMQALSTGVCETTDSDNIGITFKTTFNVPAGNKKGTTGGVWSNASTSTPIKDLKFMVKTARDAGFRIDRIVMAQGTVDNMIASDEVKGMYSGIIGLSNALLNPTVDQLNVVLGNQGLPAITVVDPSVAIEAADGTQSIVSPWSTGKVALLSSQLAGKTQFTLTAEEKAAGFTDPAALAANRDIVRITRYAKQNPYSVFTKGETVAFPVLNNPKGLFLLNTENATTWA